MRAGEQLDDLFAKYETTDTCPICGKTYTTSLGRATCGDGSCPDAYLSRHGMAERPQNSETREALAYRHANLPAPYYHADLAECATALTLAGDNRSIRLHGGTGRGKTYLAVALLKQALGRGMTARFERAGNYVKAVRATYRRSARESERDILDDYAAPAVLVLDDLGAEAATDSSLAELLTLVEERGFRGKTTIITTNKTLRELHDMEPRLASRMREWRAQDMAGADRREFPVGDTRLKDA